jgi:ABC-type Co2+ transport system permease subunit
MQIGQRKFTAVAGSSILMLGLGFIGLLVGKLDGAQFVSTVYAVGVLVGGYCGLNVTGSILGGKK